MAVSLHADVFSMNLAHRHLTRTQLQLTVAASKLESYYAEEAKKRSGARNDLVENLPPGDFGKARDKAGKVFGVSGRSVATVGVVRKKGIPDLVPAAGVA